MGSEEEIDARLEAAEIFICTDNFHTETKADSEAAAAEHMFLWINRVAGSEETNCDEIMSLLGTQTGLAAAWRRGALGPDRNRIGAQAGRGWFIP